jgi:hypothetical protein
VLLGCLLETLLEVSCVIRLFIRDIVGVSCVIRLFIRDIVGGLMCY